MKSKKSITSKEQKQVDFNQDIVFYAFRYALGRKTYAVGDVCDYIIKNIDLLADKFKKLMIKEIEEAISQGNAGMNCDIVKWNELKVHLKGGK